MECFDASRQGLAGVQYIDPVGIVGMSEFTPLHGPDVMKIFNSMKSMYTRLFAAFRKSGCNEQGGQLIEDSIESDTIFYENYAKNKCPNNARLMLYVHLLWGRAPPAFCLRTKPEHAQSQTGIPGKDINTLGSPAGVTKRELSLAAFGDQLVTAVSSLGGQKMSTEQLAKVHEEESAIRAATLSREQNVSRYFKLLSDAEERNQLAM